MDARRPPTRRTLRVVLALFIVAVVAGIVWFGGERADPAATTSPDVIASKTAENPSAELAAPDNVARASALASPTLTDPVRDQGPTAPIGMPGPSSRLHGRVLPAAGRAALLGKVAVAATDVSDKQQRTYCGVDGAYAFESLEPGRYWLRVGSVENGGANVVADVRGDTRFDIQLDAPPDGRRVLPIRVVDEVGKPVETIGLFAVATAEAPGEWLEEARIGASNPIGLGRYEVAQRQPSDPRTEVIGTLFLDRDLPLHVSLMRYQRVLESRLVVRGSEAVQFVLASDDPLAKDGGIRLRAIDGETKEPLQMVMIVLGGGMGSRFGQAHDGACEFLGLPPGTYRLQLRAKDHANERRDVRVPPGEIVELGDVPLSRGHWISGRILDETGKGRAFSISVDPCAADGATAPQYGAILGSSSTERDGSFRIGDLAPGFHRLEITGERGMADCVAVFDVREGPVENATLTVMSGIPLIVDPDGKHGLGARFAVLDEKGVRVVSRDVTEPEPVRVRLAPGRYTVEFRSSREDPAPRTSAFEIVCDPVVVRMR